ncbi:MAG: DNA/RNA non-specific endonuclease [Cyanobium sp.]
MESFSWDIPLRITVTLGGASAVGDRNQSVELSSGDSLELTRQSSEYTDRRGYDPDFLGVKLALPTLTDEQFRNAARPVQSQPAGVVNQSSAVLNYEHFSIVMNRRRQLAFYTVVNIDGASLVNIDRSSDLWSFDPRIAESEQIGDTLYKKNKLDRGHLVRRLDPVWGSSASAAKANEDTFHFTNCSPQHERFNQNNDTWQGIEDYLLNSARNTRQRLTVFTGPVMTEVDPLYRGVRLPLRYWKIAVSNRGEGKLTATAFLLDQQGLIYSGLERFEPSVFQVKIDQIQKRTGLDLGYIKPFEVSLKEAQGLERIEEDQQQLRLTSLEQIQFL